MKALSSRLQGVVVGVVSVLEVHFLLQVIISSDPSALFTTQTHSHVVFYHTHFFPSLKVSVKVLITTQLLYTHRWRLT